MHCRSRILIVDDTPTNVVLLEEILGEEYQLTVATSGEEACRIAPCFQPALILLDVMMPGIDGYETCRRLRATPGLRGIKILMVSAKTMLTERLEGYAAGADDYIIKPFDTAELLAKIRVYLRLKSIEEIDQLKTKILDLLSHKTRTPLNGIIAPAQILVDEPDLEAPARTALLEIIQQSGQRLLKLLQKGEMLKGMKSGAWDFQAHPGDLCEIVRTAVSASAPMALQQHVQIVQELSDTAMALVDLPQIYNVVMAILENGMRFSPPHTCVVVRLIQHQSMFHLTVTDQGSGIAPDVLPYVFEAYGDMTHNHEGDGLSLAIARQILLAHNGLISVDSTPGHGTTFLVQLPVLSDTAEDHSSLSPEIASSPVGTPDVMKTV
ncbi:MAG: hybrid sensor histidine kinase/response regulator [Candidatus Tectomicrobia bacterium]|uniref:histidine kinase n=1 Tax=Tectimicrobiota bacterium TaxID=2528274 RepID=A0A937W611_UNCTE|nr:hybrid sensor histidine kinase/response regulator [Candidatus Tectomicrobia bacterium]